MFGPGGENRSYNYRATVQPISKAVLAVAEKEKVANVDDNVLQAQLDALKLESQLNETVIRNLQNELDEEKRKVAHLSTEVERYGKMLDKLMGA
jgi:DNA-binding transcriptional regulator GbsR (MarR family)